MVRVSIFFCEISLCKCLEVIFGYAPFVSNSFEELEIKILDDKPIEV